MFSKIAMPEEPVVAPLPLLAQAKRIDLGSLLAAQRQSLLNLRSLRANFIVGDQLLVPVTRAMVGMQSEDVVEALSVRTALDDLLVLRPHPRVWTKLLRPAKAV
jgi:hypothetical protein